MGPWRHRTLGLVGLGFLLGCSGDGADAIAARERQVAQERRARFEEIRDKREEDKRLTKEYIVKKISEYNKLLEQRRPPETQHLDGKREATKTIRTFKEEQEQIDWVKRVARQLVWPLKPDTPDASLIEPETDLQRFALAFKDYCAAFVKCAENYNEYLRVKRHNTIVMSGTDPLRHLGLIERNQGEREYLNNRDIMEKRLLSLHAYAKTYGVTDRFIVPFND